MLNCKPHHYVKYWKFSTDENDHESVEIITNDLKHMPLSGHHAILWKLIDGFNTVEYIIEVYKELYKGSSEQEINSAIYFTLKEMAARELIVLDWNPFG